ncbi:MAG: flagellar protein [Defluviitaleaceae bacterium]|nr:flagellar protein [Defluviitaleaceae bacterium]MCL2239146.1 flagellar protein [Defluviitaleaceae bacterium]
MNVINCPRCGRMFSKDQHPICKECMKAEEEKFEEVRLFVKDNPHCSAQEVSEACEISVKRLMHYVREGKLEISQGMAELITCSKCGRPIKSGRMCERCVKSTTSVLESIVANAASNATEAKKVAPGGMFTK